MRRLALLLTAALVGALVATPAYAGTPSVTVANLFMAYGSGSNDQIVTYTDLPAHTDLNYTLPTPFPVIGANLDNGAACLGNSPGGVGACSDLTGSGHVHIKFGADSPLAANQSGTTTVTIGSLSLQASGTVTEVARTDMAVSVTTPDSNTITVVAYNKGPGQSINTFVNITGFSPSVVVNISNLACHWYSNYVGCGFGSIYPSISGPVGSCPAGLPGPPCVTVTVTIPSWQTSRITVSVDGACPDPDPSNNTAIAFPDAPIAQQPDPLGGSGHGGGGGGTGPTGGSGSPSASAAPSASAVPSTAADPTPTLADASPSGGPVAAGPVVPESDYPATGLPLAPLVAGGAIAVLQLAGAAGVLTWHRVRRRRVTPSAAEPPDVTVVVS